MSGLDAQADLNGAMKDTIKWVTPSKTWAGDDLANLQSVKIYRKNAGYATTELTKTADLIANSQLLAGRSSTIIGRQVRDVETREVVALVEPSNALAKTGGGIDLVERR